MWKVVIADDEVWIREGIRELLESFALDIEICGEAKNGLEALGAVKKMQPDIILVDICMPKLNGIKLIEAIRQEQTQCKVIIITGHDEFDYARQAIHLRVDNYLLKPIVDEELYKAIKAQIQICITERESDHFQQQLCKQLDKHKLYLQKHFLRDWLEGNLTVEERKEQQKLLQIEFPEQAAMVVISAPYNKQMVLTEGSLADNLIQYTAEKALQEGLACHKPSYVFADQYQNFIVLAKCEKEELDCLQILCREIVDTLMHIQSKSEGVFCTVENAEEMYVAIRLELQKKSYCKPIVKSAKEYIITHYMKQSLDLSSVAESLGISPPYLSRLMKQELGFSFKDFITSLRISKAKELMQNPERTIHEISEMVGYSNQHYFSTAFKMTSGLSPSEYRKELVEKHR